MSGIPPFAKNRGGVPQVSLLRPGTLASGTPKSCAFKMQYQMPDDIVLQLLAGALPQLEASFRNLPPRAGQSSSIADMAAVLSRVAERMADNYPYFHPLYAGQMLKPPHPLARAAYALAMEINPNNHALDGGRASSRMEVEAVREIAK